MSDFNYETFKFPGLMNPKIFYHPSIYEKRKRLSYPEFATFYYIKLLFRDAINWYRPAWLVGKDDYSQMEADIFIPSINTAIEVDGNWHSDPEVIEIDLRKSKKLKSHKIDLIRMRARNLPPLDDYSFKVICKRQKNQYEKDDYGTAIKEIIQHLIDTGKYSGPLPDINLERDIDSIYKECNTAFTYDGKYKDYIQKRLQRFFHPVPREESVAALYPELGQMADVINGDVRADMISPWSSLKVWWYCPNCKGYFPASPLERLRGMGCWHCENRCVLKGFNDFKTTHPELEKKYSPKNNIPSDARVFDPYASVMWICDRCGGIAQATFKDAARKNGILYCYSCKKEMQKEGHCFYKIEETAIRNLIGDEEFEKKEEFNRRLKKIIHTPPTNPESKDFKFKDLLEQYRGDLIDETSDEEVFEDE